MTAIVAGVDKLIGLGKIASVVGIAGWLFLAYQLFHQYDVAAAFGQKPFSVPTLLLAISLSAGWQLTFAPYVANIGYLPFNHHRLPRRSGSHRRPGGRSP